MPNNCGRLALVAAVVYLFPIKARDFAMSFSEYLRRQARACLKLSDAFEDPHLCDRMKSMADDLKRKADQVDEYSSTDSRSIYVM